MMMSGFFWKLLKKTFDEFFEDNSLKLSASLSYYTIIISLAGGSTGKSLLSDQ